ncbi:MAG: hypothetical protein QNL62_10195 [Gammaproteobacteria bacterium]|nr:hypothetical protein [Gammaproteobacteria bacterium]
MKWAVAINDYEQLRDLFLTARASQATNQSMKLLITQGMQLWMNKNCTHLPVRTEISNDNACQIKVKADNNNAITQLISTMVLQTLKEVADEHIH